MSKSKKNGNTIVVGVGPPCPRCNQPTQAREHKEITTELLAKPFYYNRWYCCKNRKCRTTLIMPREFIVETLNSIE